MIRDGLARLKCSYSTTWPINNPWRRASTEIQLHHSPTSPNIKHQKYILNSQARKMTRGNHFVWKIIHLALLNFLSTKGCAFLLPGEKYGILPFQLQTSLPSTHRKVSQSDSNGVASDFIFEGHDGSKKLSRSKKNWVNRRVVLEASTTFLSTVLFNVQSCKAGLVQFPCTYELMNTYHFMRAGESVLESRDVVLSNPLFL